MLPPRGAQGGCRSSNLVGLRMRERRDNETLLERRCVRWTSNSQTWQGIPRLGLPRLGMPRLLGAAAPHVSGNEAALPCLGRCSRIPGSRGLVRHVFTSALET